LNYSKNYQRSEPKLHRK